MQIIKAFWRDLMGEDEKADTRDNTRKEKKEKKPEVSPEEYEKCMVEIDKQFNTWFKQLNGSGEYELVLEHTNYKDFNVCGKDYAKKLKEKGMNAWYGKRKYHPYSTPSEMFPSRIVIKQ
jgi:hypothetical protein